MIYTLYIYVNRAPTRLTFPIKKKCPTLLTLSYFSFFYLESPSWVKKKLIKKCKRDVSRVVMIKENLLQYKDIEIGWEKSFLAPEISDRDRIIFIKL